VLLHLLAAGMGVKLTHSTYCGAESDPIGRRRANFAVLHNGVRDVVG
jgi:hypothetical protein